MTYVFYERDDAGDHKVGWVNSKNVKLPQGIKDILDKITLSTGEKFDHTNKQHLSRLPLIFSGQRLYVVETGMS